MDVAGTTTSCEPHKVFDPHGASAASKNRCGPQARDAGLTIAVRDHGAGIATEDLPHLFERFYRGASSRRRASGSGMGLWIARGFVSAQNGRVWAENAADGGARVTMVVPVADDAAEGARA